MEGIEIWKDISGFENRYQVSNIGNVRSKDYTYFNAGIKSFLAIKGKPLHPCKAKGGYMIVNLKCKSFYLHRLVCEAFIGIIPKGYTVNHKNGNKEDNCSENLEIMTYSENHLHAFRVLKRKPSSLGKFGADHNGSKPIIQKDLNGNIVKEYENARQAALEGFNYKNISSCCNGKSKSHKGYVWQFKNENYYADIREK
jgi:hypothetical protein